MASYITAVSRRRFVSLAVGAIGVSVLAACGQAAPATSGAPATSAPGNSPAAASAVGPGTQTPKTGGGIVVAFAESMLPLLDTISPNSGSSGGNSTIQGNVYETLYRNTVAKGLEDWLAEKTEVSPDGLTWTLTLRSGIKFHDGTDFDAAAVKVNLDTRKNSQTFPLRGQIEQVKEITVVDPRTLRLSLSQPAATLRTFLANSRFGIQSPTAIAKYPNADYAKNAAGTGPFELAASANNQSVTLVRYPEYWGPKSRLDKLEFRTISDETSSLAALEAGDIQLTFNVPLAEVPRIRKEEKVGLIQKTPINSYIYFNTGKAPVADPRVRLAMVSSFDSEDYLRVVGDIGKRVFSLVPATYPGYVAQPPYQKDVARGKQLLAEAGIQPGTPISVISTTSQFYTEMAQLVVRDLQTIGLSPSLRSMPGTEMIPTLTASADNQQWQVCVFAATIPYPEPDAMFFRQLYGPGDAPVGNNWSHYKNPELDRLLTQQTTMIDAPARAKVLADIQRLAWTDLPMYSPLEYALVAGVAKSLRDVDLAWGDGLLFGSAWLAA